MLTNEQINSLFAFCEKHLVYFYEVQAELVDHLANAIEEEMKQDKNLTFESALDKVYSRFGVMGFAPLVSEKAEQLRKRYKRQYWKLVRQQFGWPQVTGFMLSCVFFYTILSHFKIIGLVLVALVMVTGIVFSIYNARNLSGFLKKSGKKFMSAHTYFQSGVDIMPLYIIAQFLSDWTESLANVPVISLTVALYLVFTVASFKLNRHIKTNLMHEFPEVFQVAA